MKGIHVPYADVDVDGQQRQPSVIWEWRIYPWYFFIFFFTAGQRNNVCRQRT